jgi:hypothetical protein
MFCFPCSEFMMLAAEHTDSQMSEGNTTDYDIFIL